MRLFVALQIPTAVRDDLTALIQELSGTDTPKLQTAPRWVRSENLHVTLKFIGHVDPLKLDPILEALAQVRSKSRVEIGFRGLGFFPNEKRPRVLWVGIEGSPNLAPLAGEVDRRLEPLGVPRETREFAAHLTLARFDPPGISEKLRALLQTIGKREFGAFRTSEFHLIESKTKPTGAEYTTLQSFRFAAEA